MSTTKQMLWSIVCRFRGHPMDWWSEPTDTVGNLARPDGKKLTRLHGRCQLCGFEDTALPLTGPALKGNLSSYPALSEFVARATPVPGKLWKPYR